MENAIALPTKQFTYSLVKNLSGEKTKFVFMEINMNSVFFVLEIIGVVAFAVSGAFVAIKTKFDIFGVIVVGCITAVGGGITRDLIAGQTPPKIFENVYILGVAAFASILAFCLAYAKRKKFNAIKEKIEIFNNYFDAAGLATFTIMGVEYAFQYGLSDNIFLAITMGVLTGVGGGLLRDLFTETTPYIFTKHIYAIASILGASVFYVMRSFMPKSVLPSIVGIAIIFLLRVFATIFHWRLPKAHVDEKID